MQSYNVFRHHHGKVRRSLVWTLLILLAAMAGGWTLVNFQKSQQASAAAPPQEAAPLEFAASDVALAEIRELRQTIPLTGSLQALNQTTVKAKVAGEIKEVLVREGAPVKKGQVLARFDTVDLQARLDEKIANLEGAKAQLIMAEKNQQNNQSLLKQKFISQNAYDNTQSSFVVSRAALKSIQAQVDLARNALNDGVVRAPMEGFIARRTVQPGEKVSQDSPLFSIVDLSRMELQAPAPANEIPNIRIGQEAAIKVDGIERHAFTGRVERINPAAEAGSRSINVYITLANPDSSLKGGMFANGVLSLANSPPVLTTQLSAIRDDNGKPYVYTLEEGKLARRPVEPGLRSAQDGLVEIRSGLKSGALVVTARMDGLKPGMPAVVRTAPPTPAAAAAPARSS
ncbi:MAG: efflux RND transporter periplasmic adaptor subunit [Betaproteobacteria bacterium]|nr:efflux RND transporter periplasmic adaptor subunit [Betaproteobacteria bacterium]